VTERIALCIRNQKKKSKDLVSHFKTFFGLNRRTEEKSATKTFLLVDHRANGRRLDGVAWEITFCSSTKKAQAMACALFWLKKLAL